MKKIFIISLFLYLFCTGFVFAQDETNQTDELLAIYQVTNDSVNRLISLLGFFATAFAVFIAGITIFFVVKQLLADKEIREYKETIKQQKLAIEKEVNIKIKEMGKILERLKTKEQNAENILKRIGKIKPSSKEAQKEFKKVKEEIEELKRELDYQRGKLSSTSGVITVGDYGGIRGVSGSISIPTLSEELKTEMCPNCGHPNPATGLGMTRCSNCNNVY